jgi:tyrosyl-tRNA synthetase
MSDGRKFGKTEEGNVWLDVRRTSSYRFYQYWIQTDDKDVGRFLRFFTFLSLKEIQEIEKEHLKKPELREGQRRLAFEMTSLIHGEKEAGSAGNASQILFGGKIEGMQESDLLEAAAEMPKTERTGDLPVSTVDALAETGLCKSKGMARKDIKGGGIYVNNLRIINEDASISREDLLFGQYVLLRKGKKTYHLLRFRR